MESERARPTNGNCGARPRSVDRRDGRNAQQQLGHTCAQQQLGHTCAKDEKCDDGHGAPKPELAISLANFGLTPLWLRLLLHALELFTALCIFTALLTVASLHLLVTCANRLGGVKSDEHGFFTHQSKVDTEVFSLALSNGVGRMSARIFPANLACSPIYENSVFRVELGEGWS